MSVQVFQEQDGGFFCYTRILSNSQWGKQHLSGEYGLEKQKKILKSTPSKDLTM